MERTDEQDGGTRRLLRLEGLALFAAATALYAARQAGLALYLELFLVPDIAIALYLFGRRAGAAGYNATHTTLAPLLLAAAALVIAQPLALAIALIWLAHIGLDRALGYGLKQATGFRDTHLGRIGRA